jgi:hypothetical protein
MGDTMSRSNVTRDVLFAILAFLCATALAAQNKPITYKGLTDSLKMHGLSNAELTQIIKSRGVDFELTSDMEAALKGLGADADLIAAVRASYKGAPAADKGQAPTNPVSPPPTTAPPATPPPTPAPQPQQSKPEVPANAPVITSIRDVKKLFIEKMPNDLDEYIKAEISRQMPGRLVMVLHLEDADAVMKGVATNRNGNVTITDVRGATELWAGEAGDKGLYLTKIHGGEKKVAERLVSSLKKAIQ